MQTDASGGGRPEEDGRAWQTLHMQQAHRLHQAARRLPMHRMHARLERCARWWRPRGQRTPTAAACLGADCCAKLDANAAASEQQPARRRLSDVELVRRNFVGLIEHHKRQQLYLSVLLFALLSALGSLASLRESAQMAVGASDRPHPHPNAHQHPQQTQPHERNLQPEQQQPHDARQGHSQGDHCSPDAWLLAAQLAPLALALALLTVWLALDFGRRPSEEVPAGGLARLAQHSASALAWALLNLPAWLIASASPATSRSPSAGWPTLELAALAPPALLLAPIYLQPLLFEGHLSCLLSLVPSATLLLVRLARPLTGPDRRPPEPASVRLALAWLLVLALALLRRSQFRRLVRASTFAGAGALIEAKVSMEQQRQQQETLLLSVLPAYVADQVKRNMLKKTTSPASLAPASSAAPVTLGAHLASAAAEPDSSPSSQLVQQLPSAAPLEVAPASGQQLQQQVHRRGFNELYIRTYNNVSLLYGDIVGFTRLCTQLSSSQLVRLLNDLFSQFDLLAERHRIMRIKILGDCYYGVAGIPEFAVMGAKSRSCSRPDNHAASCVNMGLDMIDYIRCLNVERAAQRTTLGAGAASGHQAQTGWSPLPAFELNMRIGVHTGHIHSGVIGLKKWQFDVWSNDVSIAMHCESSGVAGRVQVTEATVQQLSGAFTFERAKQRDSFLEANDIRTYLVRERLQSEQQPAGQSARSAEHTSNRRKQLELKQLRQQKQQKQERCDENNIRAATIGTIRQTLLACDPFGSLDAPDSEPARLALNKQDLKPLSLDFRDAHLRRSYGCRPCGRLARELACLVLVLVLALPALVATSRAQLVASALALLLLALAATSPPWASSNGADPTDHSDQRRSTLGCLSRLLGPVRRALAERRHSRLRSGLAGSALALSVLGQMYPSASAGLSFGSSEQLQLTVILALLALDGAQELLGLRTKFLLLLPLLLVPLASLALFSLDGLLAGWEASESASDGWQPRTPEAQRLAEVCAAAMLVSLCAHSLALARQAEYASRASFLWRQRLSVDHEELEYVSGINKVLLENILPSHVVQHYLTTQPLTVASQRCGNLPRLQPYMRMSFSNVRNLSDDLYHEQHDSVAVMFASIPHFYEFYDESDISKQGLGCIALLNEIICDFDKLLLKNKFSRIEKIKTIGSTYMAAAGLRPTHHAGSRTCSGASAASASSGCSPVGASHSQATTAGALGLSVPPATGAKQAQAQSLSQEKVNLICMVQFASSLMGALNSINRQSFQVFKLRVGVNTGPVIAGIIGAQRPFYDIWGDCVNIASRMESLGEVDRIQVEERTARLLMESLCTDSYSVVRRGPIDVKGKGGMVTYFVDKRDARSERPGRPQQQQRQLVARRRPSGHSLAPQARRQSLGRLRDQRPAAPADCVRMRDGTRASNSCDANGASDSSGNSVAANGKRPGAVAVSVSNSQANKAEGQRRRRQRQQSAQARSCSLDFSR